MAKFAAARARGPRPRRAGRADRALPRRLHRPAAARARAPARRRASCSASSPPTRWSSASTSARWTRRSASRSRARSPRCGRCGAAPGAAGAGWRSTWRARTRSTSSSAATPTSSSTGPVEAAILDHENEQIHAAHLLCAAHEGPLDAADDATLGPRLARAPPSVLVSAGDLRERPDGTFVPRRAGRVPGRGASRCARPGRDDVAIVDVGSGELLGTVDVARAHTTTHEGAIYLHGGRSFEVAALDLERAPRARAPVRAATGTRSPSARPTRTSSGCSTAARRSA